MTHSAGSEHDGLRLSRVEIIGSGVNRHAVTRRVDWRSALHDALFDYDVPSGKIVAEFERLSLDAAYVEENRP